MGLCRDGRHLRDGARLAGREERSRFHDRGLDAVSRTGPRSFIDESHRAAVDGGTYLFGAVCVPPRAEAAVRDTLRRSLPGGIQRFHWRKDRNEVRLRGISALAQLDLEAATVYRGQVHRKQERARQDALWSLAYDQHQREIHDLVFEARERTLNRKDSRTLENIQRTLPSLRYTFVRPLDEPLLWTADYLLGAVGEWLEHGDDKYVRQLPDSMLRLKRIAPHR